MKKYIKILFILIGTFIGIGFCTQVQAATASIKSNKPNATVGDNVTITVTIKAAAWNLKVNGNGVTATSYVDNTDNAENATITKSLKLNTSQAGTYTISLSGDVSDGTTGATTNINTSTTVTVSANNTTPNQPPPNQPNTTKSGDATLKSITIGGKTYSGSSLKDTISYTAESKVNSIKISATKNNSKATVSGTGTKSLVAGQTNKFQINVTAENGAKKTYNVNIIRLADDAIVPNIIDDQTQVPNTEETKPKLTSLIIKDIELNPEFNPEIYTYTTNVKNMKELEIDATANIAEAKIDIEGAGELTQGDNVIKITVTLGEEKTVYIIDLYNEIEQEIVGMTDDSDNKKDNGDNKFIAGNLKEVLSILMICSLGIIAIRYIILSYMLSKQLDESIEDDLIIEDDIEDKGLKVKNQNIAIETGRIGRHF